MVSTTGRGSGWRLLRGDRGHLLLRLLVLVGLSVVGLLLLLVLVAVARCR